MEGEKEWGTMDEWVDRGSKGGREEKGREGGREGKEEGERKGR